MPFAVIIVLALTAAPPGPVKLASPGLNGVAMPADLVEFYGEHLAQKLRAEKLSVVTARDIGIILGQERQKALLGCSDSAESCIAELAGALGVEGTVTGSIAKLGDTYQLNLKVLGATDAGVLAQHSAQALGEKELLGRIDDAAVELSAKLKRVLRPREAGDSLWWAPAAAGGVLAGAGAVLLGVSAGVHGRLTDPNAAAIPDAELGALVERGNTSRTLGLVGLGVGAAALATAGAMLVFSSDAPVAAQVQVGPSGASVGLVGVFP